MIRSPDLLDPVSRAEREAVGEAQALLHIDETMEYRLPNPSARDGEGLLEEARPAAQGAPRGPMGTSW
jgi:hypothetical protein